MSARLLVIPANAQDVDRAGEGQVPGELAYDRAVRVLVESGSEVLAVAPLSFYLIRRDGRVRYLHRETLFDLLSDERAKEFGIVATLVDAARALPVRERIAFAVSAVSPRLARSVFDAPDVPGDPAGFARFVASASAGAVKPAPCDPVGDDALPVFHALYGELLDALGFLGVAFKYGNSSGNPCFAVGEEGFEVAPILRRW